MIQWGRHFKHFGRDLPFRKITKLYKQIVGISIRTICAPLVADSLHTATRDFMDSVNHNNQAKVIEDSNSTNRYRYFDDLVNIDDPYFEGMVN